MNNKLILVILLILSGCSKRPSDGNYKDSTDTETTTKEPQTDSQTIGQMNYEKSMIH
jgi:PBP1b-binding outer membrane lipoprotein LpoB